MPSVGTYKAQPVTRTFVCTQESGDHWGTYYFTQSAVDAWIANNSSDINKIGEGLLIVTGDFSDIMSNLSSSGRFTARKSLIDFGKEIVIGNTVNSRLLVLRRVQTWDYASVGGDGREAYVVVENNTEDLASGDAGRWTVRVARA